jgi:3-hydroxyisobutyrate dehydrogenase-like beta-hydroxyacid dehydrogenase
VSGSAGPGGPRPVTPGQLTIAVLGLGEAGSAIAADLAAAGVVVRGFDPRVPAAGLGIIECDGDAEACRGADVILSLTTAHEAMGALRASLPVISPAAIYADLNTSSSVLKEALSALAAGAGIERFADVALMAPVPGQGLRTPMLVAGTAAADYAGLLGGLGATVEVLDGPPGAAADRKLVRSVFFKGLAAAVTESLRAARVAGCEDWIRDNIAAELTTASDATVDRLEQGSIQHARRRAEEMADAAGLLRELGIPPRIAKASEEWLRQLLKEQGEG